MVRAMTQSERQFESWLSAFAGGLRAAPRSVFSYVLFATYIGIGALAHDLGFSLIWVCLSTILVWAAPAQVITISTLGTGSTLVQGAIAVALSGVRLLPMVVALLPRIKSPATRWQALLLTAHLTAVSMWVESFRLGPGVAREWRVPFCNGLGVGLMSCAMTGTVFGFLLAGQLPGVLAAAVLFLTPISFLVSTANNSKLLVDRLALALGLVVAPVLAMAKVGLDILVTGLVAGTIAYAVHRLRKAVQ
jgi:predicted branched-subunit amino acid permease